MQADQTAANVPENAPLAPAPAASAWRIRLRGSVLAAACLGVLAVAGWLNPRELGLGTHRELGLPACGMLARTGWPCPTCGLTTSVSAMAHGQVALAWRAHPFGVVMFVLLSALALAGLAEAVRGKNVLGLPGRRARWSWVIAGALPAGWVVKIVLGWADGTLPLR